MSIMAGGKGNFAYACTRVKAKKRFLVTSETYSRLMIMDVHEIGRFLGETQYRDEVTRYGSRYTGANLVEVAVTRNLGDTYSSILSFTTGHLREMVRDYLKRWDMYNVKTILRGKTTKVKDEDIIDTLVPAGSFSEDYLKSFIGMSTVQEIVDALSKEPSLRLTPELVREVVDTGRLAALEDHLDKVFYSDLLNVVKRTDQADALLNQFIRREVDVTNLKVLLKLKAVKIPEDQIVKYLIPGGMEYDIDKLRSLASSEGITTILDDLERSSMFEDLKGAIEKFRADKKLSNMTIALDKALIGTSEKFAHFYPLSVLPIVNYMIRKKVEVDNIRIIARGKQAGLTTKVMEELLVV